MKTEHIERLWEYCTPHWKYLLLIPQNSHLGVKHFSFRDLSGQWTHHTGGGGGQSSQWTCSRTASTLCEGSWDEMGWSIIHVSAEEACSPRQLPTVPPPPPRQTLQDALSSEKRLRLCEEVCCSFVAVILNLSSCLWITLTNYEFSLMFFGGGGGGSISYNWRSWVWSDLDRLAFHSSRRLSILPELLIPRIHWLSQNGPGSFDAWEEGDVETGRRNPPSSSRVPRAPVARASGRENLLGSVAICHSVYTRNSKWVNAAGTPSGHADAHLLGPLQWHSEGQGQGHAVMAPYITPPPTRTQSEHSVAAGAGVCEQGGNNVWAIASAHLRDAMCNTEKIKTNALQAEINNRPQAELSDAWLCFFRSFPPPNSHLSFSILLFLCPASAFGLSRPCYTLSRSTAAVEPRTDTRGASASSKRDTSSILGHFTARKKIFHEGVEKKKSPWSH